ncbi:UPF0261 domain protein [Rutstroemia sp. NJR-2017a BVV2]|nr:UPF0261 domain protein [Rutstroemia sp. NJR-2017a BVV2]
MSQPTILLLGTCDSKLEEILYLRAQIISHFNCAVLLADIGRTPNTTIPEINFTHSEILHDDPQDYSSFARNDYITHIIHHSTNFVRSLYQKHSFHGIIGLGGSGGTSICASIMRNALSIGFPKLIISTMASGNISPYVGETDITMMYSVVDIAGTNSILKGILDNAAGMIAGAAAAAYQKQIQTAEKEEEQEPQRKGIAITMFGITTPCIEHISTYLSTHHPSYELYIFHATGSGGRAMERLIRERRIAGVLDITTTEIADHICGGVLSAGPERLSAAAEMGIPQMVSVGACECVNFGPRESVPEKFRDRVLVQHNPDVTLMRASAEESAAIGGFIAGRLREKCREVGRTKVWLPVGGTSVLAVKGGAFYDEEADRRLFGEIERGLEGSGVEVVRREEDVNSKAFAESIASELIKLLEAPA